jgi:hypothetical protein
MPTGASTGPSSQSTSSPSSQVPTASIAIGASPDAPAHQQGYVLMGNALVYVTSDGTEVPVPVIDGLEAALQAGKAVYQAAPSNTYGLAAGSYAGEFRPDVTAAREDGSTAQTGGIVLTGRVVTKMIADRLAAIKAGPRWIVALPVDIRSSASAVAVSYDRFGQVGLAATPRVEVSFTGSLPVVESIPTNGGYHILVENLAATAWQVIDPVRLSLSPDVIDSADAINELVVYGTGLPINGAKPIRRDFVHDGRVPTGQPMLITAGSVSVSLAVPGSRADIGPDNILSIGDVPVFVASS